jgi:peptidyl-prolyl cis-trans isomerase C
MIFSIKHKSLAWPAFAALALLLITIGCTKDFSDYHKRVVVRVNETDLTASQYADLLASRLKVFNALSAKDSGVISQAKSAVVQEFIVQVVTQDWAKAHKVFVKKEHLDEEIKKTRKSYPDDIAFRKALAHEGLSYESWEQRLNQTLLERLVMDELRKALKKSDLAATQAYYQKNRSQFQTPAAVRLRQIVLDSEMSAQRVKKEIDSGKSLTEMAKKFSITPEGSLGGDLGWVEKGYLDIFDKAFQMGVGQRSGILKSPFGYHIFEVTAKRPSKALTFDEAKNRIESLLLAQHEQELYSNWLEEQVLKARVFKDDDFLKQIQVQTRSKM